MKDATGELSMTAIAVVAIAAIGVVFSTLIWPTIKANIQRSMHCSQAFNCDCSGSSDGGGGMCKCYYCQDEECSETIEINCPDNDTKAKASASAEG